MMKKLTRTGNSVAIVLDKPILEAVGLTENAEVEVSTDGQIIIIAPKRDSARARKFRKSAEKINRKYAGLFKRLSE